MANIQPLSSSRTDESPPLGRILPLPGAPTYRADGRRAPQVSWEQHLDYFFDAWEPGQHISVIAPTGRGGKTYMVTRGLLPELQDFRVVFFDVKDYDETVTGPSGKRSVFPHNLSHFPNRAQIEFASHPKWFRVHVKSGLAGTSLRQQQQIVFDGLRRAYRQRDWIIVADELKFLVDYEGGLRLYPQFRDIWTRGRSSVTLIAMTQYPSRVPTEMYGQATHLYLGRLNAEGNKRLGELAGQVDYKTVRSNLAQVRKHQFLYLNQAADQPEDEMMITGL